MSRYRFQKSRKALHEEAIAGQLEAVQVLLDNGEDVNQRDKVFFSVNSSYYHFLIACLMLTAKALYSKQGRFIYLFIF